MEGVDQEVCHVEDVGHLGLRVGSPVLKICFGPPTAESKNLKNHVNLDVCNLFLGPQPFGPPKMSLVLRPPVAWSLILRTGVGSAAKLEEKEKFLKIVDSHSRECFCASIIIILFKVAIYWKAMHLPSISVLKQTSAHFVIQPTMFP